MKIPFSIGLLILIVSCSQPKESPDESAVVARHTDPVIDSTAEKSTAAYRYEIFHSDTLGYGYDIFQGDKRMIRQTILPAVQGIQGFATEDDARKVAEMVVDKLSHGIMPPTVSEEELRTLGILP